MKAVALVIAALIAVLVGTSSFWVFAKRIMHADASAWFHVDGEAEYFSPGIRCSAGVFPVQQRVSRDALTVYGEFTWANRAFDARGLTAVRIAGYSPRELPEVISLGGETTLFRQLSSAFGRIAPCGTRIGPRFERAFTQPGATLVFRGDDSLVMILDPQQMRLFVLKANFV